MVEIREEKIADLPKGDKNGRPSDTLDNRTIKKMKMADDLKDIFLNSVKEMRKVTEMIEVCEKELSKFQKSVCLSADFKGSESEVAKTHFEGLKVILKNVRTGLVRNENEIENFTSHLNKLQEIIPSDSNGCEIIKNYDGDVSMNSPDKPEKADSPKSSCCSSDSFSGKSDSEPVTSPELKIDTADNSSQDSVEVETAEAASSDEEAQKVVEEYLRKRTGLNILSDILQKQIAFQSLPSQVNSGESSFCESVGEDQYNQLDVAFQKDLSVVSSRLIQEKISSLAEKFQTTDKVLQHSARILKKYADKAGGGSIYHINKNDIFVD